MKEARSEGLSLRRELLSVLLPRVLPEQDAADQARVDRGGDSRQALVGQGVAPGP